ncbi:MAG TPA: hypothetical protein PKD86_07125 [Gemmatales bacterium]|nr:hypothetical protein [Gemmatales bacterium]HMP59107.1 hypothetical protein [Gemmatales bacterium]
MKTTARVLSVGQCYADGPALERAVAEHFQAQVDHAATAAEAQAALANGLPALVLVNRIFDADGGSGLDFIRALRSDPRLKTVPIMLVSNYADWQSQAVALGAVPGFGKDALGQPAMFEVLRPHLPALRI